MPWSIIAGPPGGGGFEPLNDLAVERDRAAGVDVFIGQLDGVNYVIGGPSNEWQTWGAVGSPTANLTPGALGAARLAVSHESDGRLVMFVADDDADAPIPSSVWQMSQNAAGSPSPDPAGWSQWNAISHPLPGTELGQPAIGFGASGELYVFIAVFDPDAESNFLFFSSETGSGSGNYSAWQNLGGPVDPAFRPAVVTNADGRVEVFVRDTSGDVKHIWQTSAGGGWSGWSSLGTPGPGAAGDVSVAIDGVLAGSRAGCLEALVVGNNSHLYQISQVSPGGGWSAWNDLGGVGRAMLLSGSANGGETFARPAIASNSDGTLEAYVGAADNNVYRIRQQSPGGAWGSHEVVIIEPFPLDRLRGRPGGLGIGPETGWASLGSPGAPLATDPAVGTILRNDLIQLFVLGADGNLHHISQRSGSTW